jgi:hypothetical protein
LRRLIKEELRYLTEIGEYTGMARALSTPTPQQKRQPGIYPRGLPKGMVDEDSSEGYLAMMLMDAGPSKVTDYLEQLYDAHQYQAYPVKQIIEKAVEMCGGAASPSTMGAVKAWLGAHYGNK